MTESKFESKLDAGRLQDANGYFQRTVNAQPGALFRVQATQANVTSAALRVT